MEPSVKTIVASLMATFLFTTAGFMKADAYEAEEIGTATKYLMNVQYVDRHVRDAYYAMPLLDLLDLVEAKLDRVDSCYQYDIECIEENKSYNIIRSIYFNRLGETGPQVAVLFDQLTDAYFMCYKEEEEPELCEYLHDMQNAVYEWAAPRYAQDIATYAWLIDELLKEDEEPIYNDPTTDELLQYALERINEDRAKFDLPPVSLSANQAAQVHAEDVFSTRAISHWMTNGEKPYMTYSRLDGTGDVWQNVATWGYEGDYHGCQSGQYLCEIIDPFEAIDELQYSMVYDDAESNWGHRDNILYPYHTHVSIGIAYDDYFLSFVQNFEVNYVELSEPPIKEGRDIVLNIEGELVDPSLEPSYIAIYYDEYPSPQEYERNAYRDSYGYGELVGCIFGSRAWYCENADGQEVTSLAASTWGGSKDDDKRTIVITKNLRNFIDESGVYTAIIYFDHEDGTEVGGFSYSIFVK